MKSHALDLGPPSRQARCWFSYLFKSEHTFGTLAPSIGRRRFSAPALCVCWRTVPKKASIVWPCTCFPHTKVKWNWSSPTLKPRCCYCTSLYWIWSQFLCRCCCARRTSAKAVTALGMKWYYSNKDAHIWEFRGTAIFARKAFTLFLLKKRFSVIFEICVVRISFLVFIFLCAQWKGFKANLRSCFLYKYNIRTVWTRGDLKRCAHYSGSKGELKGCHETLKPMARFFVIFLNYALSCLNLVFISSQHVVAI